MGLVWMRPVAAQPAPLCPAASLPVQEKAGIRARHFQVYPESSGMQARLNWR